MPSSTTAATAALPGTTAIRAGIALLGTIGFALSYDALRQMALAIHIRGPLTYAFPLVIDGFIAIGIGALLILRTAPLLSRLYVWTLVGLATLTSIWANALHAVRLNQQTRSGGLHLDDVTVGALSAIAPLALAGAVHLYLVIRRHPTPRAQEADAAEEADAARGHHATGHGRNGSHRAQPLAAVEGDPAPPEEAPATLDVADRSGDVAPDTAKVPKAPEPPSGAEGQEPVATLDELLAIARTAPPGRGGRASRRHIEAAIRAAGHRIGKDRLTQIKDRLQAELDQAARQRQSELDREPVGAH
ncbi:DUF2637 domain-containing protein [Streptomyces caatingaensis]|uniref:DUF2637 domain-containing protein n=1 Tax=Streptomyces caatingaensis TaxID=1678637 RepID=A0A0K9X735_9ACTN|nr:DUF2637 domain-containing protein [Streptomyces caatingaensis]KNB48993.1 hypothetical protein AC230_26935 [Streptomyces caatingaensis]